jgi:hypothetical protein
MMIPNKNRKFLLGICAYFLWFIFGLIFNNPGFKVVIKQEQIAFHSRYGKANFLIQPFTFFFVL